MAKRQLLPPSASSLSTSMRDLGYTLKTAVADLIDNSISAGATKIEIFCMPQENEPYLAIVDNGQGMNSDEILNAMRHGKKKLCAKTSQNELGRFGLGLKTASFSQCRQLTIASSQNGKMNGAEWDLDTVDAEDEWVISILEKKEIKKIRYTEKIKEKGTIVLWRKLDRLFEDHVGNSREDIVYEKLNSTRDHLALVFHRFLAGEIKGQNKISLWVNGHKIEPFDPFFRSHTVTQSLPKEVVKIDGEPVEFRPYILPHHSKLSKLKFEGFRTQSDFVSNQGTYIYRNGRLMAWGDWFRLIPKGEKTKLARIQIDFSSVIDEFWTIDIKKSQAKPPYQVKERLRKIIPIVSERSHTIYHGKGKKLYDQSPIPIWVRYAAQSKINYCINQENPLIRKFENGLDKDQKIAFKFIIDLFSNTIPIELIYSDYSNNPLDCSHKIFPDDEVQRKLERLKCILGKDNSVDKKTFEAIAMSIPFLKDKMDLVEKFIEKEL